MKKTALTLILIAGTLAGCGTPATMATAPVAPATAQAAAKDGFLKVPTAEPTTVQQSNSKLKGLQDNGAKKTVAPLKVTLPKTTGTVSGPWQQDIQSVARFTLSSMNSARTYEDGCRVAYAALDRLNEQTGFRHMVIRTGLGGARACTRWDSAYAIAAMTLNHLAYGYGQDGSTLFNLTVRMLDQTKNYEDGAKAGYAILEVIQGAYPDPSVRNLADIAYGQAKSVRTWQDAHNIIRRALQEMAYRPF